MSPIPSYLIVFLQTWLLTTVLHVPVFGQQKIGSSLPCSAITVTVTMTVLPKNNPDVSTAIPSLTNLTTTKLSSQSSSTLVPVSRAGGFLNPSAAAEANPVDATARKAFVAASITDSAGLCLAVDTTAGDFRENLIPVTLEKCNGSQGQAWDIVTSGKHNNVAGSALVMSTLTQGCLNFDPRRAEGDQVIMFSCGGRADGGGAVTDSQLFQFDTTQNKIVLRPANEKGRVCLVNQKGKLGPIDCGAGDEQFVVG